MTDMTPIVDAFATLIVVGSVLVAASILWLHTWLKSLERNEAEDDNE